MMSSRENLLGDRKNLISYPKLEECTYKECCDDFGGDETKLPELTEKLREWLIKQPHLPKDVSDRKLTVFLLRTKLDLKKAEDKLDLHLSLRNIVPELYVERHPSNPDILNLRKILDFAPMPNLTPERYGVFITRFLSGDDSPADPWSCLKFITLSIEVLIEETRNAGDIVIVDCENVKFCQIEKFTATMVKKIFLTLINGNGFRVKRIQFINAPTFLHRFLTICRLVLKPKIAARIQSSNVDGLYEFLPKSVLPADYGGDNRSMAELSNGWYEKLFDYNEMFLKQQAEIVDESLRPGEQRYPLEYYGIDGTFRKIELD